MEKIIVFLFDKLLAFALKVVGIVLVLTVLLQIFSRIRMTAPFSWTEELSRFSFIWFCFLGSAYTLRLKLHLGIDYYYNKFSPRIRLYIDRGIYLLILFFGFLLFVYGIKMMGITSFQKSPILRISMAYMYMVLPTTGFFFIIFSFSELLLLLKRSR